MSLFSQKETQTLSVKGMHCPKCVARVKDALENVEGVTQATVGLEEESAVVEGRGLDPQALVDAVTAIDFEAALA